MKKISVLVLALVTAFALTSDASARQRDGRPGKGGMGPCPFTEMDKDKDGKITKSEWDEAHNSMFKNLDKDSNGSLSQDEIRPPRAQGNRGKRRASSADDDESED